MNIPSNLKTKVQVFENLYKNEEIEHLIQFNKDGYILANNVGFDNFCRHKNVKTYVSTHNHPSGCAQFSSTDIISGIKLGCHEVRVFVKSGLCRLVEIPESAYNNPKLMKVLDMGMLTEMNGLTDPRAYFRNRDNLLKKFKLKFRTIKI